MSGIRSERVRLTDIVELNVRAFEPACICGDGCGVWHDMDRVDVGGAGGFGAGFGRDGMSIRGRGQDVAVRWWWEESESGRHVGER